MIKNQLSKIKTKVDNYYYFCIGSNIFILKHTIVEQKCQNYVKIFKNY